MKPVSREIDILLNPCTSFYDLETGLAYVEKNLKFERGTRDFEFSFSGTGCNELNFNLRKSSSLKLELFYEEQEVVKFTTFVRNGNSISVDKNLIGFLPFNSPFYIVCSALFEGSGGAR